MEGEVKNFLKVNGVALVLWMVLVFAFVELDWLNDTWFWVLNRFSIKDPENLPAWGTATYVLTTGFLSWKLTNWILTKIKSQEGSNS